MYFIHSKLYRQISLKKVNTKLLNKTLTKRLQQCIKTLIHYVTKTHSRKSEILKC